MEVDIATEPSAEAEAAAAAVAEAAVAEAAVAAEAEDDAKHDDEIEAARVDLAPGWEPFWDKKQNKLAFWNGETKKVSYEKKTLADFKRETLQEAGINIRPPWKAFFDDTTLKPYWMHENGTKRFHPDKPKQGPPAPKTKPPGKRFGQILSKKGFGVLII